MKKIIVVVLALCIFSAAPQPLFAAVTAHEEPSAAAIVGDVILARPLGFASAVLGTAFFIVGLPFTIPTGSVGIAAKKLIGEPLVFTFGRPIGEMD